MRKTLTLIVAILGMHGSAEAQSIWRLSAELGASAFSETAHDTSSTPVRLVPWHPTLYTLRLTRSAGRVAIGLGVSGAHGDMAGKVDDFVVLAGFRYWVFEAAPELGYTLGSTSKGGTLQVHAGPLATFWFPDGGDARSTWGGQAGATLGLPLTDRWDVTVRGDLSIMTSETTKDEASAEVIRAGSMRRARLGLGIARKL